MRKPQTREPFLVIGFIPTLLSSVIWQSVIQREERLGDRVSVSLGQGVGGKSANNKGREREFL